VPYLDPTREAAGRANTRPPLADRSARPPSLLPSLDGTDDVVALGRSWKLEPPDLFVVLSRHPFVDVIQGERPQMEQVVLEHNVVHLNILYRRKQRARHLTVPERRDEGGSRGEWTSGGDSGRWSGERGVGHPRR